jgi:arginine N-succinyltransferase
MNASSPHTEPVALSSAVAPSWQAQPGLQAWLPDQQALPQGERWRQQLGQPLRLVALDALQSEQAWLWADAQGQPQAVLRWRLKPSVKSPRFSFHVGCRVHASPELGLYQTHNTLQLGSDHSGQPELLELAHAPGLNHAQALAALLALLREAMAAGRAQASAVGGWMTVELPGQRDTQGRSPFWQGLGAWVYQGDPLADQARWGERWWAELASLLPQTTLYLTVMSLSLRASVARVGDIARVHAQALRDAGFVPSQHVRIDDGGPIFMRPMP